MRSLPAEAYCTYPESAALYAKLAAWVGVDPRQLVLAAGSDGVIRSVFEAYVSPGDTVIHTLPTFAMYSVYSKMYGARVVGIEYRPSAEGPVLPAEELLEKIRTEQPKLVCLPNPDSPTGTVVSSEMLERIVQAAGDAGALILVDEAYHPFHPESVVPWIQRHPHLVVCRSTGKAWGMAGIRIGYGIADAGVAETLHKVRPMYEVGAVAVHAFEAMLDHVDAMQASVARLEAGKTLFLTEMESLGFQVLRGAGNFCHVAFGDHADAVHAALENKVTYRKNFAEPCLAGFSRFSAAPAKEIQHVVQLIRQAVGERK
jgi:histidinol-phosphate aminotransferase